MSGMSAVRNGSVLEHATMPLSPPRAMQQSSLDEFESDDPDVPYEIPTTGTIGTARTKHREWYWSERDYDSYECPDCDRGLDEIDRFEVHHIDRNPRNGDPDNLIAICRRCHGWRHADDKHVSGLSVEEWKAEFLEMAESDFGTPAD